MKLFDLFETVKIDNVKGLGEVPDNQNVDYLGLRVRMRPSVFLKLAAALPREQAESAEYIKQHLEKGGGIAAPWLVISVPPEWEDNDLKQPARVVGHEGRNRMYAVIETEGDSPVETHLFFSGGVRNRHIKPKWIERLNNSIIPQGKTFPMGGPFFTTQQATNEDTTRTAAEGAPGTLKAKITRLYGGNVTCEKAKKLKNRRGATSHDKAQANWFLNMQDCSETQLQELFNRPPKELAWKQYPYGMWETTFDFRGQPVVVEMNEDVDQSTAKFVFDKLDMSLPEHYRGYEIIFRVDRKTSITGSLGTSSIELLAAIVEAVSGFLGTHKWDFVTFAGEPGSRNRLYMAMSQRLASKVNAQVVSYENDFVVYKPSDSKTEQLDEIFNGAEPETRWWKTASGSIARYATSFEFDNHLVRISLTQDQNQRDLHDALEQSELTENPQAVGYSLLFDVDGDIEKTGLLGRRSIALMASVVKRVVNWMRSNKWDYITFIGERGSRNKLYQGISRFLARETGSKIYFDFDTSDFVIYKPTAISKPSVNEAFDYKLPAQDWKIVDKSGSYITFEFNIDDNAYTLELMHRPEPQKRGIYEVMFAHKEHSLDISGTGSAFKVFSAVAQLIKYGIKYQTDIPIKGIFFSAQGKSRTKLYNKLSKSLADNLGWKWTTDPKSMPYDLNTAIEQGFLISQPTLQEVGGVGIVVKGVNTTADVGPREIQKQARKFLNKVTAGGIPPQTQSNGKIPSVK